MSVACCQSSVVQVVEIVEVVKTVGRVSVPAIKYSTIEFPFPAGTVTGPTGLLKNIEY
jgi:hypothetical protein